MFTLDALFENIVEPTTLGNVNTFVNAGSHDATNKNLVKQSKKEVYLDRCSKVVKPILPSKEETDQAKESKADLSEEKFLKVYYARFTNPAFRSPGKHDNYRFTSRWDDGIDWFRFESWGNWQIRLTNENKNTGKKFGKGHSVVAIVQYRELPSSIWYPIGIISIHTTQKRDKVLIYRSTEHYRGLDFEFRFLLNRLLRQNFGLIPDESIMDKNLAREHKGGIRDYTRFALKELQEYLGIILDCPDNFEKPYKVKEDKRQSSDIAPKQRNSVRRYTNDVETLRKQLKSAEKKNAKLERKLKVESTVNDYYRNELGEKKLQTRDPKPPIKRSGKVIDLSRL